MKTKLLLVILIGSFLVPNISMAAGYESNDFIISLYQGWDKLEEGRLVFGAPLYDHDDVYDFVKVQHNQTVNTGKIHLQLRNLESCLKIVLLQYCSPFTLKFRLEAVTYTSRTYIPKIMP